TDVLMHAVVAKEGGLRTARRISHVFVLDVPTYPEALFVTDAAINIFPDLETKRDIVQNAIDLHIGLGLGEPRVAILSAVEVINPKNPDTTDAASLCKMAERGQISLKEIDPALANGRVVVAHLGNGCSMCALSGGRSVEASWGFSALDGLPMGTRPGRLDPGVILYLLQVKRMSVEQVQDLLYHECGLKGLSGISSDVRELLASEDPRAQLALDSFSLRCARMVAELATVMGGLDGLVFTAGIGEHAAPLRANIGSRLSWLGVAIDAQANARHGPRISSSSSRLPCYVIATNEELMIARHALAQVRQSAGSSSTAEPPSSARRIHP